MNIIRVMIVSMMIIVKLKEFGFCEEFQLEKLAGDIDMKSKILKSRVETWDVLSKIVRYDGSVTVMIENLSEQNFMWHNFFVRNLEINLGLPVIVFKVNNRANRVPTVIGINNHARNTNSSYILIMNEIKKHRLFLQEAKIISKGWSSRTRFAIISEGETLSDIQEVFRLMWTKYGIGKVIAFDIESGQIAAYNFLKDKIRLLNVSNIEEIFEYSSLEKDLEGYPIKVVMVHNPPTSIAIPNSTRFDGVNQILLDSLKHHMNFTIVMCKPTFRNRFGIDSSTGTISNTPRQVANREIDIDANMKFISDIDISGLEFTTPFFTERIHFIVPKARQVPIWLSMYQIFDNKVWIPTVCLFAISVVFWLCIAKFYYNSRLWKEIESVPINVLFLMTGQSISKRLTESSERLLIICGSIFAIIMCNCFTGNLFQRFSELSYYPDIDNLEELEKSGLPLIVGSYGVTNALNGTEDPLLKRLLEKTDNFNNLSTAFDSKNGTFDRAVLARLTQLRFEQANSMIENNGTQLYHAMKQSLGRFSMAYIVPQGWFFLEQFNVHINKILESGLIQKWYSDVMYKYDLQAQRARFASMEKLPRAFTLSDLTLAWYTLALGLAISSVTLLIEIAWYYRMLKKA